MPLDIFHRNDIGNILRGLNQAGGNTGALVNRLIADCERQGSQPDMRELEKMLRLYREGYTDALGAVALAVGVVPESHNLSE